MKGFLVFLALFAAASALSARPGVIPIHETKEWQEAFPEIAALIPKNNGRIWGGTVVENATVIPHQVGILVLLSQTGFCGGSLVSNNYILSAADCFPGFPNAIAQLGTWDRNNVQDSINIAEFILHPQFDARTLENDIALLRLVRPAAFSPSVQAVRLPSLRQVGMDFNNHLARFSGFGATSDGISGPGQLLRFGLAQVISNLACRARFPTSTLTSNICVDGTHANVCSSDYGGPLTVFDGADGIMSLVGIASWTSILGCTAGAPGAFTRTTMYLSWIAANSNVNIRA